MDELIKTFPTEDLVQLEFSFLWQNNIQQVKTAQTSLFFGLSEKY